jgi:opacity protein-like surface antigen
MGGTMMGRGTTKSILMLGLSAAVCLAAGAPPAAAQSERGEKWQFYLPVTYVGSENFDGEGGSFLDLSSDVGFGFAFGYNFNERWLLGFEINWMSMNYDAGVNFDSNGDMSPDGNVTVGGSLDSSTLQFVGQFNFLEKPVTPFIRGSIGSTYIDSNIPSGPPQGTCWWDPWWGYICNSWQPTYDDSSFSYAAGIGVRGDVTDTFFLEASANQIWLDSDTAVEPEFTGYRLNIGWIF